MPSPFPGVDPYLEHPELWPEVHHRLITAIAIAIAPSIRPKYRVAIEKRIYFSEVENNDLVGIPDLTVFSKPASSDRYSSTVTLSSRSEPITVTVPVSEETREGYLEIREVGTNRVITVIEILSPKNKRPGAGREAYESKRQQILTTTTHLVEIDLLRSGTPMAVRGGIQSNYRILVSRGDTRPKAQLYPFTIRDEIPTFPLPLRSDDIEVQVDWQTLFNEFYDRAGFDLAIDYHLPPVPPLNDEDGAWAAALLRETSLDK